MYKYGYRQRRRGPVRRRNMRYIRKKKNAGAQQRQLMSVQRQLSRLTTKVRDRAMYAQFHALPQDGGGFANTEVDLPNGLFYVNNLVRPNTWANIFQTNSDATDSNKCRLLNADAQLVFSPKNSLTALTPRIVRVWVVSLRKETAAKVLAQTANMSAAGLNAVANGVLYWNTFVDGGLATMIKFNPAAFKIQRYREFTLANIMQETATPDDDVPTTNTFNALKRIRMKIPMGQFLKAATGTWTQFSENQVEQTDRRYLIVHVGGWANDEDNQIVMDTNIVINTRVTN